MPSLSPFCVKVESYLRLSRLDYSVHITNNPLKGPFGKMPVLIDQGHLVADSRFIIDTINTRLEGGPDAKLSDTERATGHAISRMLEEHLYFALMFIRWCDDAGFDACKKEFSSAFPYGLKTMALNILRHRLIRQCKNQGMGRLDRNRIFELALRDLNSIESLLRSPFLFDSGPTSFDCTIHAFLKTILNFEVSNPLSEKIRNSKRLMTQINAMDEQCWNLNATN